MDKNIFVDLATEAMSISPVVANKTKVKVDDIIAQYPNGVTLTAFDIITSNKNGEERTYPVFNIKENPTIYFNGGSNAMKVVKRWLENFAGDMSDANDALQACGGVWCRMEKKWSNGKTVTVLEFRK